LFFFFHLTDPAVLVKAKHNIWSAAEGGNATLSCYLSLSGSTKFFCKEKCERAEDILIKTDGSTAQSGRFSIKYKDGSSGKGIVSVTFTHMIKSDSGMYRCALGRPSAPDSYYDFEVRVSNGEFVLKVTEVKKRGDPPTSSHLAIQTTFRSSILIDTTNNKSESGRYDIEYRPGSTVGLYMTITQLTKSDTGRYRCGYGNPLSPDSYDNNDVLVIDGKFLF
uniref:Ig-like domain-containing protein n=1 Tax=Oreochromis aureus TaxID=47969 RepID=A0AAZ1XD68_OREAU